MLSECITDGAFMRIQIVRRFLLFPIDRATINARSSSLVGARLDW
jgi:hypothetical protein